MQKLADVVTQARDLHKSRQEIREMLLAAVQDGILSDSELQAIEQRRTELGLTEEDLRRFRTEVFLTALKSATSDQRLSPDEEASLLNITDRFAVPQDVVNRTRDELARFRLLYEIEHGNPPQINLPNFVVQKGEIPYWAEPGAILEEKVLRRRYVGGSQGVSFRIARGVSYRVGAHKGELIPETGIVPVSKGELVLTDRRLIFRGDRKSFSTTWDKVLDLEMFKDGVRFSLTNKSKPITIQFDEHQNLEIVAALISHAINHYDAKGSRRRKE